MVKIEKGEKSFERTLSKIEKIISRNQFIKFDKMKCVK
jgi:hypothetical protein